MLTDYSQTASDVAAKYNVPADLFNSLVTQESGWNAYAYSPKGAVGLAQLLPSTADSLGVDPWIPSENLKGGAQYLSQLYSQFGNWRDALRAYNVGPTAAKNDTTAGGAYADKILADAPSVLAAQSPQVAEAGMISPATLGRILGAIGKYFRSDAEEYLTSPAGNLTGGGLAAPAVSATIGNLGVLGGISVGTYFFGAVIVVALLWFGTRALLPEGNANNG